MVVALLIAAQFDPELTKPIRDYIDELIFNKATTDSGIERSFWNTNAIQNFYDSSGFGVGLGTVRTSSFPLALLSNVGVIGTAFYLLFAVTRSLDGAAYRDRTSLTSGWPRATAASG